MIRLYGCLTCFQGVQMGDKNVFPFARTARFEPLGVGWGDHPNTMRSPQRPMGVQSEDGAPYLSPEGGCPLRDLLTWAYSDSTVCLSSPGPRGWLYRDRLWPLSSEESKEAMESMPAYRCSSSEPDTRLGSWISAYSRSRACLSRISRVLAWIL